MPTDPTGHNITFDERDNRELDASDESVPSSDDVKKPSITLREAILKCLINAPKVILDKLDFVKCDIDICKERISGRAVIFKTDGTYETLYLCPVHLGAINMVMISVNVDLDKTLEEHTEED